MGMVRVVCSLIRAVLDLRETLVMVVYLDRRWVFFSSPSSNQVSGTNKKNLPTQLRLLVQCLNGADGTDRLQLLPWQQAFNDLQFPLHNGQ